MAFVFSQFNGSRNKASAYKVKKKEKKRKEPPPEPPDVTMQILIFGLSSLVT